MVLITSSDVLPPPLNLDGVVGGHKYHVERMPSNDGKAFVVEHHYSHGIHMGPMCWGLYEHDELIGVCAFATPCSENVRASIWGWEYVDWITELHRLVILDNTPKNTESWFIARALTGLKDYRPWTRGVVSFADQSEGHRGIIYQASNAIYYGTSGTKSTFYLDEDGRLRHPRQCGVNIDTTEAAARNWTPVKRESKHRYLFLTPRNRAEKKWLLSNLLVTPQSYPK